MHTYIHTYSPNTCILNRKKWINFDHVICTGGEKDKDSCAGDSGGPCILNLSETGGKFSEIGGKFSGGNWVVGILCKGSELPLGTSYCGVEGRYGVYTRLGKYADFLRATVHVSCVCVCVCVYACACVCVCACRG